MKSSANSLASPFYVGCAVWGFKGWVGNFFPEKTKAADFLRGTPLKPPARLG